MPQLVPAHTLGLILVRQVAASCTAMALVSVEHSTDDTESDSNQSASNSFELSLTANLH